MKVSDESTIVMTDGVPVQATVETQAEKTAETPAEQPKKKSGLWKGVVIGGVPGILLGSAGSLFAAGAAGEEEQVPDETEAPEVNVAENVNDDMSFAEAYAAAREELGAGGVFVWNGNVYNTYNQEEWEALSDDEKAEFLEAVYGTPVMEEVAAPQTVETEPVETVDVVETEPQTDETEPVETVDVVETEPQTDETESVPVEEVLETETQTVEAESVPVEEVVETETQTVEAEQVPVESEPAETPQEGDVEVVDVEQQGDETGNVTVLDEDQIETPEGDIVNVTCVEVDGHYGEIYDLNNDGVADVALVDIDDDGSPDIQFVDENGDGKFCECEAYDISDADRLAMESGETGDALYDGMPDYTNDADASSFA